MTFEDRPGASALDNRNLKVVKASVYIRLPAYGAPSSATMTKVGCCVLCPSGFAVQAGSTIDGGSPGRSPALLDVAGTSVLWHWLRLAQDCMLIESDRLYIVCNSAEQANFRICLAKYQQQQTCVTRQIHIVSAQLGNSTAPDHTTGLIALAAAHPLPDLLIVLDGACLCEPGFSLQRFVQHTLTRNADMISFSPTILPGPSGSSAAWVELQGSSVNPRAVSITQQCSPTACYAVGPVYGLYQPTLSALLQGGASRLQDFLQLMLQSTAVYALPVHCSFDLSSLEGYLYADAFCTFCEQQWALLHSPMLSASAASPAVALPSSPQQAGAAAPTADMSPVQAALAEFNTTYAAAMTEEAYKRLLAGRSTIGSLRMPERFADATLWRWRRKYEHPVYMTSNNDYGAKPPSQPMMPPSWHGVKGQFTKNYIKSEVRTGNFSTGLPSSRVHDALTELC